MPQPIPIRFARLQANHIRLHLAQAGPGNGPPVVLLHGFPEFWYGWRKQIPALAGAGYRVLAPDQRGYNLSDKPPGVASYGVEALVDDIVGLLDTLELEKTRLVGHDWGAFVAWELALRHPQRLEKLAILNVPHPDVMQRFLLSDFTQFRKSWYIYFFQIPRLPEWLLSHDGFANARRVLSQTARPGSFSADDLEAYTQAWAQPGALTAMLNWYRAALRRGLRGPLNPRQIAPRRVRVPTLILWGMKDVALSHSMARPSAELCDQDRLVLFENATHWVQHDEAEAVNQQLIEFLS